MTRSRRSNGARTLTQLTELAVAAPQVVAIRTSRMLAAGANPNAADRAEFSRMHTEKVQAFWQSMFDMAAQAAQANQQYARSAGVKWLKLWTTPWALAGNRTMSQAAALVPMPTQAQTTRAVANIVAAAVKPVHRRATSNARRLTGRGKR